jgi:hypothetical protein
MSTYTSEPPPSEHQTPPGSRNPKAEAKAAEAYAKAMRPWYKKKRLIIPAAFIALILIASATSSSNTASNGGASNASSGSAQVASGSSGGRTATVGQSVTNAGTTYKVTSVKTTDTLGDPDLGGARADGVFVVVSLELTNNKDETKTFLDSNAKLKTSDGKEYETSDKAVLAFGDDSLMLKDIQPDLTTRGKLAFEIPPSKATGSTLVIEDLWGSDEIKVDLGL